jgi:hypothetical protein
MKHKYVKHIYSGRIYKIITCEYTGYAHLRNAETGKELKEKDIHCVGDPNNQEGKKYVYVDSPKKSEFYSVF